MWPWPTIKFQICSKMTKKAVLGVSLDLNSEPFSKCLINFRLEIILRLLENMFFCQGYEHIQKNLQKSINFGPREAEGPIRYPLYVCLYVCMSVCMYVCDSCPALTTPTHFLIFGMKKSDRARFLKKIQNWFLLGAFRVKNGPNMDTLPYSSRTKPENSLIFFLKVGEH